MTENNTALSDTRYMLVTDDAEPAHIMVKTEGWRTGPPAVLERLLDPIEGAKVECKEYRVRLFVKFETGDERYRWLNEAMWIGSATRSGFEGEFWLPLSFYTPWALIFSCLLLDPPC